MPDITNVKELAKKLNLWNVARGYIDLNNEVISNIDYLEYVFTEELRLRHDSKLKRLKSASRLPDKKFDYNGLSKGLMWHINKLMQLDFIDAYTNLLIIGKCSSGKTSLATDIANAAIQKEYAVYYCTFDEFIENYVTKSKRWNYIKSCDLLIIDDLFYVDTDENVLMNFYKAVTFLNETTAMIFISNRPLSQWNEVTPNAHLGETVRDRIISNSEELRL